MSVPTIYALATAPGRAGVALVRVSGPGARESMAALSGVSDCVPRRASLRRLTDPRNGELLDHGVVVFFQGPASYTGEDVAEYQVHGSPAVVRSLLEVLSAQSGHRLAEPGEFTRRAFENGKLDLTEAEAVADLIAAETQSQKAQALAQLEGSLSRLYERWRGELTRALAYLEADLDFPDEDMPAGVADVVRPQLATLADELAEHLDDNRRGERLRDGVQVAVIGAPNAGKSTLVNALARRDVAIVSEHAGTTRDVIEVHLDIGGYPVILADTAGLRPDQMGESAADTIESEGMRRALRRAEEADLRLLLLDASRLPTIDPHTLALVNDQALIVFNKSDCAGAAIPSQLLGQDTIALSVQDNQGMDFFLVRLQERIEALVGLRETPALTRERHRRALEECLLALRRALAAPLAEMAAEDVRLAVRALGRITGRVDVEDLLDVIFRDFCIGK